MSFIGRVERFQQARSLNELVSLTKINPKKVELIRKRASEFYEEYLSDDASSLRATLESLEREEQAF